MNYHTTKTLVKLILCTLLFSGCSDDPHTEIEPSVSAHKKTEESDTLKYENTVPSPSDKAATPTPEPAISNPEPTIIETDWSEYFDGLTGAAVLYDAHHMQYTIFHPELATTQRSPCSTFKIISSLIALENETIEPEQSTRKWSGEIFWNENWNRDIDFYEAFRTSCVWYFREVIDMVGKEKMQEELDRLAYGNVDISDWEGCLNTNNNNRALTGFWIESSLMISPKEQTEVMARIFGADSVYSTKTRTELKKVMQIEQPEQTDIFIYGKTGMGKAHGITVDAWFTGFAENPKEEETIYFCVYLGRTDGKNFSSTTAKEIAVHLVSEYWTHETKPEF